MWLYKVARNRCLSNRRGLPRSISAQSPPLERRAWQNSFHPMLLTAAAVVVGASAILFDPIFRELAISLMAGDVASTLLSRMAVPVLYWLKNANWRHQR